ncbi:response regulator [Paenibacillus sp. WQ 127069]|uniref:Response regulator n=1 Tax=Paenibacillus baimaensis TaxID=2982185 RepID=A0ABT2UEW4_9BACL|nr:response regulator [Paenibacillus sp. WQ 127069]MCU6793188.1 response regulator [Paenibacillus sp. WQ 127069]
MLKVMIIDDEILARVGIKSIIPWRQHEFEVVAEAENGEQALALAKELLPDIAITDIKMPLLNGIEFIKAMKELGMTTKFVILSSYGDFEYVKEAMKLGAEDYILKLKMEPDHLLQILIKIKEKILQEKSQQISLNKSENEIDSYLPSMREALFNRLLFGYFEDNEEVHRQFRLMKIELPQAHIYCLLVKVDHYEVFKKYKEQNDLYIITYAITNVVQEIVNEFHAGYVFTTKPMEVVVIYADDSLSETGQLAIRIRGLCERIQSALKKYLNISVTIGVSEGQPSYVEIKKGFGQAVKALQNGFALPRESIIFFNDDLNNLDKSDNALGETFMKLEQACAMGSTDTIIHELKLIQQGLIGVSPDSLKGLCASILFMLISFSKSKDLSLYDLWEDDPFNQIEKFQVLQDYIDWLSMLIATLNKISDLLGDNHKLISQAKQFIHDHYDQNISLQMVAEHLHISGNYLSHLFKKETNENFIDHLIHIRIEHAKTWITTSNYKIHEIGKRVGYHDNFYFSKIFKKVVGVTPIQYRSSFTASDNDNDDMKND